ncbi:nitroreductase family protein [Chitinimonas sp.]|uniref:nitroreductase family protein n=1 Tax=Chitinimonas sp. TaxID=1934313 RepID=UPI002F942857
MTCINVHTLVRTTVDKADATDTYVAMNEEAAMHNPLLETLNCRDSCPLFLSNQALPQPELMQLLEAGQLAPSVLGLEPWHFVVSTKEASKTALQQACHDQPQLASCSAVVTVLARTADLRPGSEYCEAQLAREAQGAAHLQALREQYARMAAEHALDAWLVAQCHVAAAHIMLAAAAAGIDSCPIWDFDPTAVSAALQVDTTRYLVALPIALGYRAVIPAPKHRRPLADMIDYR